MADHQHRALEAEQHLFEQFEGFHIEIIGRLVEHQQVGRLAEQLRQQEPCPLTAGQRLDRRARPLRTEQEVAQVAQHVAILPIDGDEFTAFGEVVHHGLLQLQLVTQLVEIRHFQLGAELDRAAAGLQFTQQQLEQRGLAGTVGAEQADAVAALNDEGKVADQRFAARMSEADVLGNDNLFAGLFRGFHLESRLALHITALAALGTQRLEGTHPAFVAGAPRLDALTNPHFLLGELLVEQGVGGFLRGQLLFLVHQEAGVIAVPVDQVATVQLQNAGRQVLQEGAVVGDEQHGTVEAGQGFFQPGDGADVQVVRGFVEQQQVGFGHQRLSQQHSPPPASGQLGKGAIGGQLQTAERAFHQLLQAPAILGFQGLLNMHELVEVVLILNVHAQVMVLGEQLAYPGQAFGDHIEDRAVVGPRQLLWQLADLQSRRAPDFAVVCAAIALDQAQHAGFARPVAADDADPLAPRDLPGHAIQQRRGAVGERYIGELEQGHGYLRKQGAHSSRMATMNPVGSDDLSLQSGRAGHPSVGDLRPCRRTLVGRVVLFVTGA